MDDLNSSARFDRIEEKIDKLSEAMISIARAEEKILAMDSKYNTTYERMNKFSEKLDHITSRVEENGRTAAIFQKAFWLIAAAISAAGAAHFFML
jgi:vacuolar-type H+-ATPase subunit D/Vma8